QKNLAGFNNHLDPLSTTSNPYGAAAFTQTYQLADGDNYFTITAVDMVGNKVTKVFHVIKTKATTPTTPETPKTPTPTPKPGTGDQTGTGTSTENPEGTSTTTPKKGEQDNNNPTTKVVDLTNTTK
ncbi:hypothetical protein G6O45_29865, partial [Salmonella enterica subsp. enterica serovar Istanbul]|nr:hypothetical protein [Salmonella enterica subsp. enterica serovar Istanbul]